MATSEAHGFQNSMVASGQLNGIYPRNGVGEAATAALERVASKYQATK